MEIVVFGAGSLGSLVGGVLACDHEVTLVAREDHATTIREEGLRVTGELEARVFPDATTDGRGLEADLAVVTVKAFDTPEAARTLATGEFEAVLSVQNGMGNEEVLEEYFETVLAGTASYGAILRDPGVVECTGIGEVVLGSAAGGTSPVADHVGETFSDAGLETTVAADVPRRLWEKLAVNAGINPVTALTRGQNRVVLEGEANELARAATRETARTARTHGVDLSNREALEAMESVAKATAANTSSMCQDVLAERRTEIDAINGYVVNQAREAGLEVPTNRILTALVRSWEREAGLR
ncbi:ketopantoate reductase family protein [Natrialbaceae archaeon A-gly3]